MKTIHVHTPCRLHFGLFAYSRDDARQFGGVGLMVRQPHLALHVRRGDGFTATGVASGRAAAFAKTFVGRAIEAGLIERPGDLPGIHIDVLDMPRSHTGLGTGTQLGMAVARGIGELLSLQHLGVAELARLVGRGQRSAIGAHGFFHGGLIVEGGKFEPDRLSPMLVQQSFPAEWRVVLITPEKLIGINGDRELKAFATMPPIPRDITAEMCRLVLLGMLPAVIERDFDVFSRSLFKLQQRVGECFAQAQGGVYAAPLLTDIVQFVRKQGIEGVGQSSWGPTMYAVTKDETTARRLLMDVQSQFGLSNDEVIITEADNEGCVVESISERKPSK